MSIELASISITEATPQKNTQYFQSPNLYPNLDCPLQVVTETDEELFNNLFDDNQIHRQDILTKLAGFLIILCIYVSTGYMFYIFIYKN